MVCHLVAVVVRPLDFCSLFSRALSKGVTVTSWIWNLHMNLHEYESNTVSMDIRGPTHYTESTSSRKEDISRKWSNSSISIHGFNYLNSF